MTAAGAGPHSRLRRERPPRRGARRSARQLATLVLRAGGPGGERHRAAGGGLVERPPAPGSGPAAVRGPRPRASCCRASPSAGASRSWRRGERAAAPPAARVDWGTPARYQALLDRGRRPRSRCARWVARWPCATRWSSVLLGRSRRPYRRWSGAPGVPPAEPPLPVGLAALQRGSAARRWPRAPRPSGRSGSSAAHLNRAGACERASSRLDLGPSACSGSFAPGPAAGSRRTSTSCSSTVGVAAIADFSLQLLPSLLETKRPAARSASRSTATRPSSGGGPRRPAARGARPRRRDVRAQGAVRRAALLRARAAAGGVAARARHPDRRQRLDARRARGLRARPGAGAGQEAVAGGRRGLAPLLRQPPAPPVDAGPWAARSCRTCSASARSAGATTRACSATSRRAGPAAARGAREIAITFITHAECHIPAATVGVAGPRRVPVRRLRVAVAAAGPGLPGPAKQHQVVSAESLSQPADKRRRALEIVSDVVAGSSARLSRPVRSALCV